MKELHFTTQAKAKMKEILESFFRQSESLGETTKGSNPSNISITSIFFVKLLYKMLVWTRQNSKRYLYCFLSQRYSEY